MQVRAVIYHSAGLSEELYQQGLTRVDPESRNRIGRFFRRQDACRTLLGALSVRLLLKERGLSGQSVLLSKTAEGKPYLANQLSGDAIGFNITHDNALIALAVAPGRHNPPAFSIGIDVMKVQLPGRESFTSFVETVGDQLTLLEHQLLATDISIKEQLCRFFWMWTLKEAYTKALGLGLGFDFKRIEFDVVQKQVKIDGQIPQGWRFTMFTIPDGDDLYEGAVAEFVGGDSTEIQDRSVENNSAWLIVADACSIVQRAIEVLPPIQS